MLIKRNSCISWTTAPNVVDQGVVWIIFMIYLNVKKLAKTQHLLRSYHTSHFSTLSVLIFLCTFHLSISHGNQKAAPLFSNKWLIPTQTSCLASNNKGSKVHYACCKTMLCMKLYCTRVVFFAYFGKKLCKSHFTKVKNFCLWHTFGPHFASVF